eukprot:6462900-Amphidinium_carterae.1
MQCIQYKRPEPTCEKDIKVTINLSMTIPQISQLGKTTTQGHLEHWTRESNAMRTSEIDAITEKDARS